MPVFELQIAVGIQTVSMHLKHTVLISGLSIDVLDPIFIKTDGHPEK